MEDWLKEIKPGDIPAHMAQLVEAIGIEPAVRLMQQYGGANVYIPKADALLRQIRDKRIREEYNGYNVRQLAVKYGLSENWINRIITGSGELDGQISAFDLMKETE